MFFIKLKFIKHQSRKALIAVTFFSLIISAVSCGKRKPPLPPIEKVDQKVELTGLQRGNKVFLFWNLSPRNASNSSVLNISRADIYRLTESTKTSPSLSEEEFASQSTLIATIPITVADFALKKLSFTDTLDFAGQPARIHYAIRFANASGQKAGFSNFFLIEPTAKVAEFPQNISSKVSQSSILIQWTEPSQNIDGSGPANVLGFNIYRIETENKVQKLLNNLPVTSNEFTDRFFEFNKIYSYFLRTVSLGSNGEPIESLDSKVINIVPKDIFPPTPPSALTIAASINTISIFFASNPENDVIGYKIYRSTDKSLPKPDWTLITPQILTTNTFQDLNVESGKTYYYYLTAVDKFGNISELSDVVSDTVP